MIKLAEKRQVPASRHMDARIEEINDRLRVVEFAIQELTMEGTVEAAEDALQAIRGLLAAVQEYWCVEQCSDDDVDVRPARQLEPGCLAKP